MEKSPLYRLEVAPLVILPLGRSPFFSYASPTPVSPGSLVSVSFGRREIQGVVFTCQALPGRKPEWMKSITRVLHESFLTEKQCAFAEELSTEYFTPLGRTLKHFLPKSVKARKKPTEDTEVRKPFRPTKDDTLLLKKFNYKDDTKTFYLDTSALSDPKRFFITLAKKYTPREQVLILVPEITLIPGLEAAFRNVFPEKTLAVLHSMLPDGSYYAAWERIRSGEASIILSTRQGLFAPYKKLRAIILTEEQDESYKQWDMSPRYHAKRATELLSSIHQAKLLFTSNTPSLESVQAIHSKLYTGLNSLVTHPPLQDKITLVNLRLERYKKNYSPFSEELTRAIQNNLAQGGQTLLYINRQGMNTFSVCESCKNVFRCKACGHTLTSTREGYFRCLHCSYKTGLFPNCPTCGHLTFKHIGFGTEKIEKEAKRLFPHARIARLDSSLLRQANVLETIRNNGMENKIDILIGTQMILKDPPLPKLSLIAMIDADSLLFFPDFKADERLFQHFLRGVIQINRSGKKNKVFAQTFHPESPFFDRATYLDSGAFLQKMLDERKELLYPPFARLMSLGIQDKEKAEAEKKANAIYTTLKELFPKNVRVHPPQTSQFLKRKNFFECTLLIRVPVEEPLPKKVTDYFARISKDCIIDVDPLTLW